MSDPVTNIEIEDVLSSIRRLVTDEARPGARKPDQSNKVPATKLVLTPALRVRGDDGGEQEQSKPEPRPVEASQPPLRLDASYSAADYVDEIEFRQSAARRPDPEMTDAEDGSYTDGGANPPWADPNATLHQAAANAGDDPESGALEDPALASDEIDIESDAAVDEPETTVAVEDWGNTSVAEPAAGEAGPADVREDDDSGGSAGDDITAPAPGDGTAAAELSQRTDTLSAKIQALEAAIAQQQDQWEPDSAGEDDYAGMPVREPIPWQDHQPVPEPDVAQAEAVEQTQPETTGVLAADESVIDEEALRELVADIVRQELQGALGERITRNVRKLVRREIHRALTAQNMD